MAEADAESREGPFGPEDVPEHLAVNVTGREDVAAVLNGLAAAASEQGKALNDGGRAVARQVTRGEAAAELARAYTGWSGEDQEGDDDV